MQTPIFDPKKKSKNVKILKSEKYLVIKKEKYERKGEEIGS